MFQTLIAQIKEYKKPSILASLFMTLEVMFEISIPFVMANLLDTFVQKIGHDKGNGQSFGQRCPAI